MGWVVGRVWKWQKALWWGDGLAAACATVSAGWHGLGGQASGPTHRLVSSTWVSRHTAACPELLQVMKDLSVLVIDQGTILDRIDYNMEQTVMKVEEGVHQLERAEKKQKQSALVICIMLLLVMIVLMLLALIFKAVFIA